MIRSIRDIYIEITSLCNLKCRHCYNDSGMTNRRQFAFGEMINIAQQLKEYGTKSVALSGGEPFLNTDIDAIIDYYCQEFELRIVSNFTCLDDHLKCIEKNAPKLSFDVSIDGYDPDSYKSIRGANYFDKVVRYIRLLRKMNVQKMAINCVMTPEIMQNYMCMIELADELKMPLTFSPMNLSGRALENKDLFITEEAIFGFISGLDSEIKRKYFQKYEVSFGCPLFSDSESAERLKISNDGYVYLCQYFYDKKFALGNILNETLENILLRSDDILKNLKTYFNNAKCSNCFIKESCNRGCIALALSGNEFVSDGKCLARKKMCLESLKG